MRYQSTVIGGAICGALCFGIWPEMWKSYGIMGGWITAAIVISICWYMNHRLGVFLIRRVRYGSIRDGLWPVPALPGLWSGFMRSLSTRCPSCLLPDRRKAGGSDAAQVKRRLNEPRQAAPRDEPRSSPCMSFSFTICPGSACRLSVSSPPSSAPSASPLS